MLFVRSTIMLILCLISFSSLAALNNPQPIKRGMPGKKRGDIIIPILDEQIAAWCDFNKQIVVTRTNILCAYVGNKSTTASNANSHTKSSRHAVRKKFRRIPKNLTPTPYEMNEYGGEI